MIIISKLIYKATGIMSKKQIMKTCGNIGKEVSENLRAGNNVDSAKIHEILAHSIGPKNAKKIIITDDLASFKEFAKREIGLTDEVAENFFNNSKSAVIPGPKSNTLMLSLRTDRMLPDEIVNTTSHELEHVLYKKVGLKALLGKSYLKLRGKKFLENYANKYGELFNTKNMHMQGNLIYKSKLGLSAIKGFTPYEAGIDGLLKQTGLKSKEELQEMLQKIISEKILLPDCDKRNLKVLQAVKETLKDESRAYKVGGSAERQHANAVAMEEVSSNGSPHKDFKPATKLTKSEMLAQLYDEAIVVLKGEIKKQKINKVKSFLGLKPKDYHTKPKPYDYNQCQVTETVIVDEQVPDNIKEALSK